MLSLQKSFVCAARDLYLAFPLLLLGKKIGRIIPHPQDSRGFGLLRKRLYKRILNFLKAGQLGLIGVPAAKAVMVVNKNVIDNACFPRSIIMEWNVDPSTLRNELATHSHVQVNARFNYQASRAWKQIKVE